MNYMLSLEGFIANHTINKVSHGAILTIKAKVFPFVKDKASSFKETLLTLFMELLDSLFYRLPFCLFPFLTNLFDSFNSATEQGNKFLFMAGKILIPCRMNFFNGILPSLPDIP